MAIGDRDPKIIRASHDVPVLVKPRVALSVKPMAPAPTAASMPMRDGGPTGAVATGVTGAGGGTTTVTGATGSGSTATGGGGGAGSSAGFSASTTFTG